MGFPRPRPRGTSLLVPMVAVGLFAASTVGALRQATATTPVLSFSVVEPDGSPALFPVALVSVFGRTYVEPRTVQGGALGDLDVPVPLDDPVVAERLAAGQQVNLLIRVFDGPPSRSGLNAAYITAAVGADPATGLVGDLSGITDRVYMLRPGLTAFEEVHDTRPTPSPPPPPDTGGTVGPDEPDCPHIEPGTPVPCRVVDYPKWSYNTLVPIAENHGAGADMTSIIEYHSTVVTQTSAAMRVGKIGFFQSEGSVTYENTDGVGLGFAPVGHGTTNKAYLETQMMRERTGACMRDFGAPDRHWYCQLETVYRPFLAHGATVGDTVAHQDGYVAGQDCWTSVNGSWDKGTGRTRTIRFELTLGPSENWATLTSEPGLWAQTTVTGQTHSGTSHIRRWEVDRNPTFEFHYMYVPEGMLHYDATQPGGGNGGCPEYNVPLALTYASNADLHNPAPTPAPAPVDPPPPPDPEHTFCGRMPDRCD